MNGLALAALQDPVLFLNIISLVDWAAINFGPGMGPERCFLRTHNHLGSYSVMAQHGGDDRRALKAKHALWIPDAGVIYGVADAIDRIRSRQPLGNFST